MKTRFTDRRTFLKGATAVAAGMAASGPLARSAFAESYPEREIRWIVYQSPGGLIDGTTRAIQPHLQEQGFNTVIDYVRGASGRIARTQLYRSEPDGYTIMTEAGPEEVLGEIVYEADYRVAEFQPIFGWFLNSFNLYVPKESEIRTLDDLIEEGRSRTVTVGTIGRGGPSHLQLALLRSALGLNLQLVHFDGGAPAFAALSGGHVEVAIGGSSSVRWSDTIDFLTVFAAERDRALPDVPTIAELGHDIVPINEVIYVHTGPDVPEDRVAKLADAFANAFAKEEHMEQQRQLGVHPTLMTPEDLRARIQQMAELVTEHQDELRG